MIGKRQQCRGRAHPHARTKTLFSFKENEETQKVPKETFWVFKFSDAYPVRRVFFYHFFRKMTTFSEVVYKVSLQEYNKY